jgi:hypothetical protein
LSDVCDVCCFEINSSLKICRISCYVVTAFPESLVEQGIQGVTKGVTRTVTSQLICYTSKAKNIITIVTIITPISETTMTQAFGLSDDLVMI